MADPRAERLLALANKLKLTDKQRSFAEALLATEDRDGKRAAIAVGVPPKSAAVMACKWLKLEKVQRYITAFAAEVGLSAEPTVVNPVNQLARTTQGIMSAREVLERLSEHARVDVADFVTLAGTGFVINLEKALAAGKGTLVKEISHDSETGAPKLKLVDGQAALDKLARHYQLYGDEKPQGQITLVAVLQSAPPALTLEAAKALLRAAKGPVIEAQARRIG